MSGEHDVAVQDAFTTAMAIAVAPEGSDDVVQAIPPDRLLAFIWVCDELVRRINSAKKGAMIEAAVALENGDLTDPRLSVNGHSYQFRQSSKNEFSDIPGLMGQLERCGLGVTALGEAVGYLKVTTLRDLIAQLPEVWRGDAYAALEEYRTKTPGGWALVDLDSPYRSKRTRPPRAEGAA